MLRYITYRLVQSGILLVLISIISFLMIHVAPGGALGMYARNPNLGAEDIARIEHMLGLDQPLPIQYLKWAGGLLTGQWGYSYRDGRPVLTAITDRLPATLELVSAALFIAITLGITIGIISAIKQYSVLDYVVTFGAVVALSIPTFWFGLIVIYIFSVKLGWLPAGGIAPLGVEPTLADRVRHLIGPAAVLGFVLIATWSRYCRAAMLDVINEDYVRTARAKGLKERIVLVRHALRNALIPLLTLAGLQVPFLFGGALVTETVFTWPGMGRMLWDSLGYRDYPVILGILVLTAVMVIFGNLLADLAVAMVDPRIYVDA